MKLFEICSVLEEDYGLIYLRGKDTEDCDIDYYSPRNYDSLPVEHFLERNNFFVRNRNRNKISWVRIENSQQVEMLDIEYDLTESFTGFSKLQFSITCVNNYIKNSAEDALGYNAFRHMLSFKKSAEKISMVKEKIGTIKLKNQFVQNPFRVEDIHDNVEAFMKEKKLVLLRVLKAKFIIDYITVKIKQRITKILGSKTIVFIGIDGVGKSTLVDVLTKIHASKIVYMGSGDYALPFLSSWIPKYKIEMLIKLLLIYLENWIKQLKIALFRMRGWNVLVDRHPRYQFANNKPGLGYYMNVMLYKYFFVRPRHVIILYESAEIICKRKNEKTAEEIDHYYKNMRNFCNRSNEQWLKNSDINSSLKSINRIFSV